MGIRRADHVTPLYPLKLALTSPTGGRSVGIVRLRTKATERRGGERNGIINNDYGWFQELSLLFEICHRGKKDFLFFFVDNVVI